MIDIWALWLTGRSGSKLALLKLCPYIRAGRLGNEQYAGTVKLSLILMSFENQNKKHGFRGVIFVEIVGVIGHENRS